MTIEDRISRLERLSDEYLKVTKEIEPVVRRQNEIYDEAMLALAHDCAFEAELRSAVSLAVGKDEEYQRLQSEWQRLTDRKNILIKELELNRWRLLSDCTAQAGGLPVDLLAPGVSGVSH